MKKDIKHHTIITNFLLNLNDTMRKNMQIFMIIMLKQGFFIKLKF